jgi:hypothetical protein
MRSGVPELALGAPPTGAAPHRANPASTPALVPIKATPALTVHPRAPQTQPDLEFAGVRHMSEVPAAAQATTTVDRPNQPLQTSVKLPEPGIELYHIGDTGSMLPDFTRPPAHVDRAPR